MVGNFASITHFVYNHHYDVSPFCQGAHDPHNFGHKFGCECAGGLIKKTSPRAPWPARNGHTLVSGVDVLKHLGLFGPRALNLPLVARFEHAILS